MAESKLWGTAKTSYQSMGESRLIVKHTQPINGEVPAGRARHIESIYIENAQGERFKYPVTHLNGARAMARHVANGGNPYDAIGEHIVGLSEELGQLRKFKGYVSRNESISEAMDSITGKVSERLDQVKKEIHGLQSQRYYESFVESFQASEAKEIPEDLMNDWIDRLTIRTFNEELKSVFPYIFKLIDESNLPVKELTMQDFRLSEDDTEDDTNKDSIPELEKFESVLSSIIGEASGLLSQDPQAQEAAIAQLNQLVAQELPAGVDGSNAVEGLTGIIDDPELQQVFKELADINPEFDVRPIIQDYLRIKDEENGTDILVQINFEGEAPAEPAPAEAPAPAAEPAPVAPAAPAESRFAEAVRKAVNAGLTLEDTFSVAGREVTLKDAIAKAGLDLNEFFDEVEPDSEIVEYIESMFDRETGNFPKGETGVLIAVEKKFGESAVPHAKSAMEQLVSMTESYRMKRLAGLTNESVQLNEFTPLLGRMASVTESDELAAIKRISGLK